jgi:hypothetical protein
MATVDTCTTPEEGWGLVSHFFGNFLLIIRTLLNRKEEGWEAKVSEHKDVLASRLITIARRMNKHGYYEESANITTLCCMVKSIDISIPANIDAIYAKHLKLNKTARKTKEAVREMFG